MKLFDRLIFIELIAIVVIALVLLVTTYVLQDVVMWLLYLEAALGLALFVTVWLEQCYWD
ncbi:MAG: hypothetical protein AAF717_00240 [Bacteroidota bacterium]